MYHVTINNGPSEQLSLRVANQDLARVLTLVGRLRILNPEFDVDFAPTETASLREPGAA